MAIDRILWRSLEEPDGCVDIDPVLALFERRIDSLDPIVNLHQVPWPIISSSLPTLLLAMVSRWIISHRLCVKFSSSVCAFL